MRESGSDIDNWTIGGIVVTVTAVVAAAVFFLQALVYRWETKLTAARTTVPQALSDYRSEQAARLAEIAMVDRATGLVRIPVAEAMAIVARQGHRTPTPAQPGAPEPPGAEARGQPGAAEPPDEEARGQPSPRKLPGAEPSASERTRTPQ